MSEVIPVFREALQDVWDDLWATAAVNLLWLLSIFLVLPAPPATLALFYYANRRAHGELSGLGDFFSAFRRYWKPAWRWGLLNAALVALLAGDVLLTGNLSHSAFAQLTQGFYLAVLGAWLLVQLYALPFLFEQENPSLRLALRNSAAMIGRNLPFSLGLGLLLIVALFLGMVLFMVSLAAGGTFIAAAANHAVINRVQKISPQN